MNLSRRSILAALGIGTVAGPAALPAFGRAAASKLLPGALAGFASNGPSIGNIEGVSIGLHAETLGDVVRRQTLDKPIFDIIGKEWERQRQDARQALYNWERNAEELYAYPSWSNSFRRTVRRNEYEKRQEALNSISEIISNKAKEWWKANGQEDESEKVRRAYSDGQSENSRQGSLSRSRG